MGLDTNTPILVPFAAEDFWKQIRQIVREEIKSNQTCTKITTQEPLTASLTYRPLWKMKAVCELFGVERPTVYKWIKLGNLKPKKISGDLFFLWTDIQDWIEELSREEGIQIPLK
jgi:predicted DNA-binding transcriptional regulator AlpA